MKNEFQQGNPIFARATERHHLGLQRVITEMKRRGSRAIARVKASASGSFCKIAMSADVSITTCSLPSPARRVGRSRESRPLSAHRALGAEKSGPRA